jgi:signal transduction histidine kinase
MNFKDLKIRTQLNLGFGLILLIILSMGLIAWRQSGRIHEQVELIYDHPLQVSRAIGELRSDLLFINAKILLLGNTASKSEELKLVEEIRAHERNANRQIEILYDRYLGSKDALDQVRKDFEKFSVDFVEFIRLYQDKNIEEVNARMQAFSVANNEFTGMLSDLDILYKYAGQKSLELYDTSGSIYSALNIRLLIFIIISLIITFFIAVTIAKSIRTPVLELQMKTRQFRSGNRSVRVEHILKSEIGDLAASFNDLAETVETELRLNEQAATLAGVMLSEEDARRFCNSLLITLLEHTDAQTGAVFLLSDDHNRFEHFVSIGLEADSLQPFSVSLNEGEFGLALQTKKIQHITSIPADTQFIYSTVNGKYIPREIITIPVIAGTNTVAMISIAGIKPFDKLSIRLLETVYDTINARMDGILAYRKLVEISNKLEQQNIELEAQKTELITQSVELARQNAELEMQAKMLDEVNRLKTDFLSNMSHELRTPLNSIIALAGVLYRRLKGKIPNEEHSYLDVIEQSGAQLLDLINDILDLSRIEAGKDEYQITKFTVNELISGVTEIIRPQANQKRLHLSLNIQENIPDLTSDLDKCRHILLNILGNAIKFTEKGSVEIEAGEQNGWIRIVVKDTGIGISKDFLPKIFDEFRQADSSHSRKYGGTGLGLAIAKKYTDKLRGYIDVESTAGSGSTFTLYLPVNHEDFVSVKQSTQEGLPHKKPAGILSESPDLSGKTILLVEDSQAITIQIKEILDEMGCTVLFASNGEEALQQIEMTQPDGVILDLMMPKIDGFEVLRRIRSEEKTSSLPVIILTSKHITKEELSFLKNNNIYELVYKGNVDKTNLLDKVARMVL